MKVNISSVKNDFPLGSRTMWFSFLSFQPFSRMFLKYSIISLSPLGSELNLIKSQTNLKKNNYWTLCPEF